MDWLLPNWVTIQWKLYRDMAVLGVQFGWRVCHDTISCIVTGGGLTGWDGSRYNKLYRDRRGLAAGGIVSRYSPCIVTIRQSG